MASEPSRNKWCAIDDITITVESTDIAMKPRRDPVPRLNGPNAGLMVHDTYAYDIFHGSDKWPTHVARPRSKANCPYGPKYHFAEEFCGTIRHSRYQPNGLHVGILLTNVCRLEILVDDESYERVDITKWFWELYKDQGDTPGFRWDLTRAANKRKRMGMLTEVEAVGGDGGSSHLPGQAVGQIS